MAPSLRVGGRRGQSQASLICCGFLLIGAGLPPPPTPSSCCESSAVWLWSLPFSQRMWDRITPSPDLLWPPIKGSSPGASWANGLFRGQPSPAQRCTPSGPEFLTLLLTDSQMPNALCIPGPSRVLPTSSPNSQGLPVPYFPFGILNSFFDFFCQSLPPVSLVSAHLCFSQTPLRT